MVGLGIEGGVCVEEVVETVGERGVSSWSQHLYSVLICDDYSFSCINCNSSTMISNPNAHQSQVNSAGTQEIKRHNGSKEMYHIHINFIHISASLFTPSPLGPIHCTHRCKPTHNVHRHLLSQQHTSTHRSHHSHPRPPRREKRENAEQTPPMQSRNHRQTK